MSNLWEKTSYRSPIQFLIDIPIREYDISKANISVLRDANVISEEQYQYFYNCPKIERAIAIGKMQGANSAVTEALKAGISKARKYFIESNGIKDSDILAIRNDAITVVGTTPVENLQVTDRVSFRLAGNYSSFYHVNTIDLYYLYDRIVNIEVLDVKGLGEGGVNLHRQYMLDFLATLFYSAQIEGIKMAIGLLDTVHKNYVNKDLDINYYREFNPESRFLLDPGFSRCSSLYMDFATNRDKSIIDISYNEKILRHFMQVLASVYFGSK